MKDKEVHGLMKLPNEVVIEQLRLELGKANAYISEMEEKLSDSGNKIKKQTLLCLESRIKNLEKKISNLKKEFEEVSLQKDMLQSKIYDIM